MSSIKTSARRVEFKSGSVSTQPLGDYPLKASLVSDKDLATSEVPEDVRVFTTMLLLPEINTSSSPSLKNEAWKPFFPFLNRHLRRLLKSAEVLELKNSSLPEHNIADLREGIISSFSEIPQPPSPYRVRVSLGREDVWIDSVATSSSWEHQEWLSNQTINLCSSSSFNRTLASHKTSLLKACYSAVEFAKDNNCDDCLLLDSKGHLLETAWSNVYWINPKERKAYTRSDNVLPGIIREILLENGLVVASKEAPSVSQVFEERLSLFSSNSVHGLRTIKSLDKKPLPTPSKEILLELAQVIEASEQSPS